MSIGPVAFIKPEDKGLEIAGESRQGGIPNILSLPSVWNLKAELEWLVSGMIPLKSVTMISAKSGTGKSWLAYGIAGAVAHGTAFVGLETKRVPVVYLDGENPLFVAKRNLKELGVQPTEGLAIWGGWNDSEPPGPKDRRIIEVVKNLRPLLIWDSLVQFHDGDEQSATETRRFMKCFRALAHAGATIIVLHHTGKGPGSKDYRGSSDIEASVDMAYRLEGKPKNGKIAFLKMKYFKSRIVPGQNFAMEFHEGRGFTATSQPQQSEEVSAETVVSEIIAEVRRSINGKAIKQIAKKRGIGKDAVDSVLKTWPRWERGKGSEKLYLAAPEPVGPEDHIVWESLNPDS